MVKHVSLFAGVGGFDLGFEQSDIETTVQVENDERCRQLLQDKFDARLLDDITEVKGSDLDDPDIITGGFPCQDISIAGPRNGLAGSRSGLFWEYARLIDEARPEWIILENVTGLLSSGGRRDLGTVLGTLGQLGYGFAYRVLDARFFGVPQRRRRVLVVGRAGADLRGPTQVLLESEGVSGDLGEGLEERQVVAGTLTARTRGGGFPGTDEDPQPVVVRMRAGKPGGGKGALVSEDRSLTLASGNDQTVFQPTTYVRSHGRNATDDADTWVERDSSLALAASPLGGIPGYLLTTYGYAVRKLMPVECERLQGFPDGWTEGFPDTTRYRMLGNAVAVPVAAWIAEGIRRVSARDRWWAVA